MSPPAGGTNTNTSSSDAPYTAVTTTSAGTPTPAHYAGQELPMMVHVTAPATLPAGYTFEAEINGDPNKLFTCEVPEGGVEEGQVFLAPLSKNYDGPRLVAPTGQWKDGICDFCTLGLGHPTLWCSLCCTQIAMAQVMSRMQLTWLGLPGPIARTRQTFFVVVLLVASYFVYSTALELALLPYDMGQGPHVFTILRLVGNLIFTLWAWFALCQTRRTMRQRYQIPQTQCGENNNCEDACCSLWCGCCITAQMLRHTGEYESYAGTCCSATGHPPGTPLAV